MTTHDTKYSTRLLLIALVALTVPTTLCHASVEPDLTMAIRQKNVQQVQHLLANGANVDARDEEAEQTPLMCAVRIHNAVLVQILLAHGASVNVQDDFGKTALMFAAECDDAEIVRLLLRKGANPAAQDANAVTATDMARKHGHTAVCSLLTHARQKTVPKPMKAGLSSVATTR